MNLPKSSSTAQDRAYSVAERDGKAVPDLERGAVAALEREDRALALQVEMLLAQRRGAAGKFPTAM